MEQIKTEIEALFAKQSINVIVYFSNGYKPSNIFDTLQQILCENNLNIRLNLTQDLTQDLKISCAIKVNNFCLHAKLEAFNIILARKPHEWNNIKCEILTVYNAIILENILDYTDNSIKVINILNKDKCNKICTLDNLHNVFKNLRLVNISEDSNLAISISRHTIVNTDQTIYFSSKCKYLDTAFKCLDVSMLESYYDKVHKIMMYSCPNFIYNHIHNPSKLFLLLSQNN
jgi:hypothetical protein